ncbi:response regulator transcription factor [Micromonospora craniellae]|uniref:DNA-binding response regulator n=1 Tax=Micromonospora craniellae TaxID=2294034 RepID=A0A372FT14_9ACTN|nr:response regulator transcription factor [Micromonospora craniellae]QOC91744.1 response regulator transcription factor [Micromonospora craniellae]RFS43764.1 DNA-binding response regulator [Micromonospora craniellae]
MSKPRHVCAIRDPIPAYRQGIARELDNAGYETAEPGDCYAWIRRFRHAAHPTEYRLAVLLSIRSQADVDVLAALRAHDDQVALLALLVDPTVDDYRRALDAGAWGVVDYAASPDEIVAALEATWAGVVRLPRAVAVDLLSRPAGTDGDLSVGESDVMRLAALASGWSVERLASHENFSTRAMFRHLQELYRTLGVSNRHEAVVVAARHGLLDGSMEAMRQRTADDAHRKPATRNGTSAKAALDEAAHRADRRPAATASATPGRR